MAQLSLVLMLTNNSDSWLALSHVIVTFASPPMIAPKSISVIKSLAPKETSRWYFTAQDNVILPVPPPAALTINVFCYDFDDPATVGFPLALYESPLAGGYPFPSRPADLDGGELWQGRSAAHAPAGGGVQLFAYDMDVVAFDGAASAWSALVPGGSASKNEDYRIWCKPVVAMADGTVVDFANDQPTNPSPPDDLSPPNPVEGNHFYIQHGSDLILYAHMQPGSLNPDLLVQGSPVTAGMFLGLAGNSGNSTNPHLHIHAINGTAPWKGPPRPILFKDISVIDRSVLSPPSFAGPWVSVSESALPSVESVIWPAPTEPWPHYSIDVSSYLSIDPLALVLDPRVYIKLHLPDPGPIESVLDAVRRRLDVLTPAERVSLLERVDAWRARLDAVERELRKGVREG